MKNKGYAIFFGGGGGGVNKVPKRVPAHQCHMTVSRAQLYKSLGWQMILVFSWSRTQVHFHFWIHFQFSVCFLLTAKVESLEKDISYKIIREFRCRPWLNLYIIFVTSAKAYNLQLLKLQLSPWRSYLHLNFVFLQFKSSSVYVSFLSWVKMISKNLAWWSTAALTQRPCVRIPLKSRNVYGLIANS